MNSKFRPKSILGLKGWRASVAAGTLCAVSAVVAPGAHAQTGTNSGSEDLQEIVVTSSKFGNNLDKAPVAVSEITQEQLTVDNINSVEDAQIRIPSLVYNDDAGNALVYIRGVGTDVVLAGLETAVATYVDGVYLQNDWGAMLDTLDLKGLQVFKGPQGTLYGRNATGGAIVVETNDPSHEFGGDVGFDYGNFNYNKAHAVINLPLTDTLAIRIAAQEERSDGYAFNVVDDRRAYVPTNQDGRIKIGWTPTSNFTAVYSLEYLELIEEDNDSHERLQFPNCLTCTPGAPLPYGFYDITTAGYAHNGNRQTAQTLNLSWDLGPITLNNVSGFRKLYTVNYDDNQLGTASEGFFSYVSQGGHTFTEDLYAKSKFQGPINFLGGASYERDRQAIITDFAGFFFPPGVHNTNALALNSYSVYADLYFDITSALKFTVGGRYNEDKKSIEGVNNAPAVTVFGTTGFYSAKSFPGTTPHAVLSYDTGDGYYYASFSRGVRSGGFTTPAFTSPKALESERLDSYEIGAKNKFLDNKIKTSAALFYGTYSDMQVLRIDPINGVVGSNAGKSRISGIELDVQYEPIQALHLSVGATALHDYFVSYPSAVGYTSAPAGGAGLATVNSDLAGTQLPRAPSISGYVSGDYSFPLTAGWKATPSVVARYTNTYNFFAGAGGPLGLDRQPANTLLNGSLMATDPTGKLSVGFWGANLGDVHYFTYASTNSYGAFDKPAAPRTYGVRFDYKF